MKIAIYQGLPLGGAKRSIEAIESLLRKKNQVTTFDASPHLWKRTTIRFISDGNALIWQRWYQRRLAQQIDRGHFDVCLVTHDPYLQCPWLLRYLKTPSVFLCQEPTRAYYEYFLKIPENLSLINQIYETINRYFRKKYEKENAQAATVVTANSIFSVESIFRSYGVTANNIYLGFNHKEYYQEKVKKLKQVVIVGNDEPQKGLSFAIKVISLISIDIRPKLLVVSPRSYDESTLVDLAKKKKVHMEILHSLTVADMRHIYSQSQLTLAVAHLEPFGLSVIESLACATPVVAVNEGGFRETIINGKTGLLVERDAEAVASALTLLLKNPTKLKALGAKGLNYVKKNFTWAKTIARLEPVLKYASRHHRS